MATIGQRLEEGVWNLSFQVPLTGLIKGTIGALYAKFADLPIEKAFKAYAIWGVARSIFEILPAIVTDDQIKGVKLQVGFNAITAAFAIQQLKQMGLMGDKMMCFALAAEVCYNVHVLKKSNII